MIGMQYTFILPDDFDMGRLRAQVTERAELFDRMEGLYQKAFLISENDVHGASRNSYAPFCFWNYTEAMANFFVGDKFKMASDAFGRPAVTSWLPLYFSSGKAKLEKPVSATREIIDVAPGMDLEALRNQQYKLHRQWAEHPENQSGFIGLDVNSWKLVRFALWTRPQETLGNGVESFEVLHWSAPGLDPRYFVSPC